MSVTEWVVSGAIGSFSLSTGELASKHAQLVEILRLFRRYWLDRDVKLTINKNIRALENIIAILAETPSRQTATPGELLHKHIKQLVAAKVLSSISNKVWTLPRESNIDRQPFVEARLNFETVRAAYRQEVVKLDTFLKRFPEASPLILEMEASLTVSSLTAFSLTKRDSSPIRS